MKENVRTADLKIGMYVILPAQLRGHSFLEDQFLITSEAQIKNIAATGVEAVACDVGKSRRNVLPTLAVSIVPEELEASATNRKITAREKAELVHAYSVIMIERLMGDPTGANIGAAKKGIEALVDLILTEKETAAHLLRLTSQDYNTYVHSVNVGIMGISLAKALFRGTIGHNMHNLGAGFFFHDLGKVKVDGTIVNKSGQLAPDEMLQMKLHPAFGYQILRDAGQLTEESKIIVLQHHERKNGTGYPCGLRGDEIHVYGKICSIVDIFDALSSERPYKPRLAPLQALKLMREGMTAHFERQLLERFVLLFA
ncbi:MAG: DUF3391 domain-containing protein [Smithellaceae bacterium]|nr:DUF3391 domain-containing protein [Smithellaceae bacterium]